MIRTLYGYDEWLLCATLNGNLKKENDDWRKYILVFVFS